MTKKETGEEGRKEKEEGEIHVKEAKDKNRDREKRREVLENKRDEKVEAVLISGHQNRAQVASRPAVAAFLSRLVEQLLRFAAWATSSEPCQQC